MDFNMTDYEKITEQFFSVNFFVLESSSNLEKLKIIFTYHGLDCFLNFIYFFLGCTATVPVSRLSLVVASGLLIVAASPVAEHGPQGTWAQQFWHTGLAVSWHVDSSWTRDRTRVPCISRWILYHWTTREVLDWIVKCLFYFIIFY